MMPCGHNSGIWVWKHQHLPKGFPEMKTKTYHVKEKLSSEEINYSEVNM